MVESHSVCTLSAEVGGIAAFFVLSTHPNFDQVVQDECCLALRSVAAAKAAIQIDFAEHFVVLIAAEAEETINQTQRDSVVAVEVSVEMIESGVKHRYHSAGAELVELSGWQLAGTIEVWHQSALAAEVAQVVWPETPVVEKQVLEARQE